jgi:hypothetical protein
MKRRDKALIANFLLNETRNYFRGAEHSGAAPGNFTGQN